MKRLIAFFCLAAVLAGCDQKSVEPTKVDVRERARSDLNRDQGILKNLETKFGKSQSKSEAAAKSTWIRNSIQSLAAVVSREPGTLDRTFSLYISVEGTWGETELKFEEKMSFPIVIVSEEDGDGDKILAGKAETSNLSVRAACLDVACERFVGVFVPKNGKGETISKLAFPVLFEKNDTLVTSNLDTDLSQLNVIDEQKAAIADLADGPGDLVAHVSTPNGAISFAGLALGSLPLARPSVRGSLSGEKGKLKGLPSDHPFLAEVQAQRFSDKDEMITLKLKPSGDKMEISFLVKKNNSNPKKQTFNSNTVLELLLAL